MFYSSVSASEKQDRTSVLRACSTVLYLLQFCPLFREPRQDHSPQSTFYSSAPSSENQDRTSVLWARSTALPPLQRIKTGPQSSGHVLQFCPLFREARRQQWPHGATLQQQLWGNVEDLLKTTTFIQTTLTESRRDQEEGGELDSHEEASPEEIKNREVVLG